jgi:hypothetical protein
MCLDRCKILFVYKEKSSVDSPTRRHRSAIHQALLDSIAQHSETITSHRPSNPLVWIYFLPPPGLPLRNNASRHPDLNLVLVVSLDRSRRLEQLLNLLAILAVLDDGLEVRVAANVLLFDEDVWDGALARDLDERLLKVVTVALLVQLVRGILGAVAVEEALGVLAVGAVALAEDDFERECVSDPMYLCMVLGDVRMTGREYDVRWGVKDTCAHGMQRERGTYRHRCCQATPEPSFGPPRSWWVISWRKAF